MLFNITADVAATERDGEQLLDALEGYSPAIAHTPKRATIIITLPAETLSQAVRTGLAVIEANTRRDVIAIEAMTTEDFDRREGVDVVPELVSITEASELLGISRQALQQQVDRGNFQTARKVGPAWVLGRAEVEKHASGASPASASTPHPGPQSLPRDDENPLTMRF